MANQAAWQRGFDMGSGKSRKQGKQKTGKVAVVNASFPAPGAKAPAGGFKTFKKGGRVRKTGLALLHKDEYVVPAKHRTKHSRKRAGHKGAGNGK